MGQKREEVVKAGRDAPGNKQRRQRNTQHNATGQRRGDRMRFDSARSMIFQAYHVRRGDSSIAGLFDSPSSNEGRLPDNDWRIVHGLECGQVIAAVEKLPQHLQALVRYCFGPFTREELAEDAEWVQLALYAKLQRDGVRLPGQGKGLPTAEQLETLRYLCAAALYHHAEVTWPYSRPGLPTPRAVRAWMLDEFGAEVDVRRWSASGRACWGGAWEWMLRVLDSWEAQALAPVAELVPQAA